MRARNWERCGTKMCLCVEMCVNMGVCVPVCVHVCV